MSTAVNPTTGMVPTPSSPPAPAARAAAGGPARRKSARRRAPRALLGILALVVAAVWAFPVYWMVNSSLLPNAQLQSLTPTFVPFGGSFDNFTAVISGSGFTNALRMSLAVSLVTVVAALVFAFLAALAISRFRFRGRKTFIVAVLVVQMLPAEGLFIAQYKLVGSLNLLNTVLGVSTVYIAAVVARSTVCRAVESPCHRRRHHGRLTALWGFPQAHAC